MRPVILSRPENSAALLAMRCDGGSVMTSSPGCGEVSAGCGPRWRGAGARGAGSPTAAPPCGGGSGRDWTPPCGLGGGRGGSPKIELNCAAAGATRVATRTMAEAATGVRRPITKESGESVAGNLCRDLVRLVNTGNTAAKGRSGAAREDQLLQRK